MGETASFQASGCLLVGAHTGSGLIGRPIPNRPPYQSRRSQLAVDPVTGTLDEVWQQKGPTPDVLTDTPAGAEIWFQRVNPYGHPLDGSPITDWGPLTLVAPVSLTTGDGGLSKHPS